MKKIHTKICCIQSIEEALLAIEHGADMLGFVSEMPSGPGIVEDGNIITSGMCPYMARFAGKPNCNEELNKALIAAVEAQAD